MIEKFRCKLSFFLSFILVFTTIFPTSINASSSKAREIQFSNKAVEMLGLDVLSVTSSQQLFEKVEIENNKSEHYLEYFNYTIKNIPINKDEKQIIKWSLYSQDGTKLVEDNTVELYGERKEDSFTDTYPFGIELKDLNLSGEVSQEIKNNSLQSYGKEFDLKLKIGEEELLKAKVSNPYEDIDVNNVTIMEGSIDDGKFFAIVDFKGLLGKDYIQSAQIIDDGKVLANFTGKREYGNGTITPDFLTKNDILQIVMEFALENKEDKFPKDEYLMKLSMKNGQKFEQKVYVNRDLKDNNLPNYIVGIFLNPDKINLLEKNEPINIGVHNEIAKSKEDIEFISIVNKNNNEKIGNFEIIDFQSDKKNEKYYNANVKLNLNEKPYINYIYSVVLRDKSGKEYSTDIMFIEGDIIEDVLFKNVYLKITDYIEVVDKIIVVESGKDLIAHLDGNIKKDNEVDMRILDSKNEVVAEFKNYKDQYSKILEYSSNLKDEEMYNIQLSFDGSIRDMNLPNPYYNKIEKGRWEHISYLKFTKNPIALINIDGEVISNKAEDTFLVDIVQYNDFDTDKLQWVLERRDYGTKIEEIPLDSKKIKIEKLENGKNKIYYEVKLNKDINFGKYFLTFKIGDKFNVEESSKSVMATPKTMVPNNEGSKNSNNNYYYDENGNLKKFHVYAINLLRNGKYKVFVYPYKNEYGYGFDIRDLDNIKPLYKFDKIDITNGGNINIRPNDIKQFPNGEYTLFFEMNDKYIGNAYLQILDAKDVDGSGFSINAGNKVTDKKQVSLIINSDNYSMIRYSESEEELKSMPYTNLTQEEKMSKKFVRDYTLSDGDGQKILYMQFKDDDGKESKVHKSSIRLDTSTIENIVSYTIMDTTGIEKENFYEEDEIIVKATGNQDVFVFMNIKSKTGEYISKDIPLKRMGRDGGVFKFERLINLSYYKNAYEIELFAKNSAGSMSDIILKALNIKRLNNITGNISLSVDGAKKPYAFRYIRIDMADMNISKYALTDENGDFKVVGLKDGKYSVYIPTLEGYYKIKTINSKLYQDDMKLNLPDDNKLDIVLSNIYDGFAKLKVNIVSDNNIKGGFISVGNSKIQYFKTIELKDNENSAVFEDIPVDDKDNPFTVSYKKGYLVETQEISLKSDDNKTLNMDMGSMYTLQGRVVDKNGNGIPNLLVRISRKKNSTFIYTDKDGYYNSTFRTPKGEKATILAYGNKDFLPNSRDIVFENKQEIQVSDIVLSQGATLSGVIVDSKKGTIFPYLIVYLYKDGIFYKSIQLEKDGSFFETVERGKYTILTDVMVDSSTNLKKYEKQFSSTTVEITEDDYLNGKSKKEFFPIKSNENENLFMVWTSSSEKYLTDNKQFIATIKMKNISGQDINNAVLSVNPPKGVKLVTETPKFQNTKDRIISYKKDQTISTSWVFYLEDYNNINGKYISIPITAKLGNTVVDVGCVILEYVNITLNGSSSSVSGNIYLYGETNENASVSIIDRKTGKLIATTKPYGRWYSANIKLNEGEYELQAISRIEGKTAYSEIHKLKVGSGVYELENIAINSQTKKYNRYTGIPSFSVWSDTRGVVRSIYVKFNIKGNLENIEKVEIQYNNTKEKVDFSKIDGSVRHTIKDMKENGKVKLKVIITTKDDKKYRFIIAELTILIDPSGYIYDKYSQEKLFGALAILEVLQDGKWEIWDAESHGQINPMSTDMNGEYAWMVPAGKYRVKVTKEGYADSITDEIEQYKEGIIIPPPALDVNIPMINITNPTVNQDKISVEKDHTKVEIPFNKAMDKTSLNKDKVFIRDEKGYPIEGEFSLSENNKVLIFIPKKALENNKIFTIDISEIKDFDAGDKYKSQTIRFVGEFKTNTATEKEKDKDKDKDGSSSSSGSGSGTGGGGGGSSPSSKPKVELKKGEQKITKKEEKETEKSLKIPQDISSHWAKEFIQRAIEKDIVSGYPDGSFKPNNKTTRAEFIQMIVKAKKLKESVYNGKFSDVKQSNWFAKALQTAVDNGIVSGYEDGTFKPNNNITRAEMVVMIMSFDKSQIDDNEINKILSQFKDKDDIPKWARVSMAKAVKANIISGYNGKLNPKENATRAEVVTVLMKIIDK